MVPIHMIFGHPSRSAYLEHIADIKTAMPTHLYQICYNARRMDRHSEAELWARFKAVRPQDACAVTPARPALHPTPEQIDAALEWAREYLSTRQTCDRAGA